MTTNRPKHEQSDLHPHSVQWHTFNRMKAKKHETAMFALQDRKHLRAAKRMTKQDQNSEKLWI